MELGNILRTQIKNLVNNCSMKFSLPLLPSLPPPSSFPSPSLFKETNKQKVQVEFKSEGLTKRPWLQFSLSHLFSFSFISHHICPDLS